MSDMMEKEMYPTIQSQSNFGISYKGPKSVNDDLPSLVPLIDTTKTQPAKPQDHFKIAPNAPFFPINKQANNLFRSTSECKMSPNGTQVKEVVTDDHSSVSEKPNRRKSELKPRTEIGDTPQFELVTPTPVSNLYKRLPANQLLIRRMAYLKVIKNYILTELERDKNTQEPGTTETN